MTKSPPTYSLGLSAVAAVHYHPSPMSPESVDQWLQTITMQLDVASMKEEHVIGLVERVCSQVSLEPLI